MCIQSRKHDLPICTGQMAVGTGVMAGPELSTHFFARLRGKVVREKRVEESSRGAAETETGLAGGLLPTDPDGDKSRGAPGPPT